MDRPKQTARSGSLTLDQPQSTTPSGPHRALAPQPTADRMSPRDEGYDFIGWGDQRFSLPLPIVKCLARYALYSHSLVLSFDQGVFYVQENIGTHGWF